MANSGTLSWKQPSDAKWFLGAGKFTVWLSYAKSSFFPCS